MGGSPADADFKIAFIRRFEADISVEAPPPEAIVDKDLLIGGDYATSEEYEPS